MRSIFKDRYRVLLLFPILMNIALAHFESLMDNSPAFAWITDGEGHMLFANKTYCQRFCFERDSIRNRSVFDIYPEQVARIYYNNIQRVVSMQESLHLAEPVILPDGTTATYMVCKFPLLSDEGEWRVGGWGIDITDTVKTNEQLSIQSQLLNSIQQAAIVTDYEGNIKFWNNFATELYGWTSDETVGRHVLDFVPVAERNAASAVMDHVRTGQGWNGEMLLHNKKGELFSAYLIASPLLVDDNGVKGVISVSMDITKRKKSEELLMQQSSILREIRFIQSHEVRRPLSNILALTELLKDSQSLDECKELVSRLKESAVQLDTVIKTLVWKAQDHYLHDLT